MSLTPLDAKAIRRKIRDLIAEHGAMTRRQILDAFSPGEADPDEVEKTLNKLISLQVLFAASSNRISDRDEEAVLIEEAKRLIREKPHSRSDLARALGAIGTGASANYLKNTLFEKLQEDPGIYLHLGANGYVLSTDKPDFERYVKPLAARFRQVATVLERAGHSRATVQEAVTGQKAAASSGAGLPSPADDSDLDFQRNASELFVYAWQDTACEETRRNLESVMVSLGLERVETAGQVVEFNGLTLRCEEPVSQGDKVRIVQPGWRLRNSRGNYLIAKAEVVPA